MLLICTSSSCSCCCCCWQLIGSDCIDWCTFQTWNRRRNITQAASDGRVNRAGTWRQLCV